MRASVSNETAMSRPIVMRGHQREARLCADDPRIHRLLQKTFSTRSMGCRVKPGNDTFETKPRNDG
jgi:hypothetical protein